MRKKAKQAERTIDTAAAARERMLQRHGIRQQCKSADNARKKMIERKIDNK